MNLRDVVSEPWQEPRPAPAPELDEDPEDHEAAAQAAAAQEWALYVAMAGVVCLSATFCISLVATKGGAESWTEKAGQVGDFFGGHLSGFGNVVGLLLMFTAVTMQRRELGMQRRELILSRKEAHEQTKALELQHAALVRAYEAAERQAGAMLEAQEAQRSLAERARLRELREDSEHLVRRVEEELTRWQDEVPHDSDLRLKLLALLQQCQQVAGTADENLLPPMNADPAECAELEFAMADKRGDLDELIRQLHLAHDDRDRLRQGPPPTPPPKPPRMPRGVRPPPKSI